MAMFSSVQAADVLLGASSLKLKVFKIGLSTSPLCTNLKTVLDNGNTSSEMDFSKNTTLDAGALADGTYPCMVIEMSDTIKFKPDVSSSSGNCSAGTEYSLDLCKTGDSSVLGDGTVTSCSTGSENRVAMYITTASRAGSDGDIFSRPTILDSTVDGLNLTSELTISGTGVDDDDVEFKVNTDGKVCDSANASCNGGGKKSCIISPPSFDFIKI
jgi:hypothetical protein